MTSVYRINYHLRAHKRDPLIEFIKSMLLTPFVLHATPTTAYSQSELPQLPDPALPLNLRRNSDAMRANELRYAEIMADVEALITEHIEMQEKGLEKYSRLRRLVPTVGTFFTPLPLREAFLYANAKYAISSRKYVPPSFNDIRRILNTAQARSSGSLVRLITFDGDMTLYPDGQTFEEDNQIAQQLIHLLRRDITVAVVTAAGYTTDVAKYEARLSGLLQCFARSDLTPTQLGRFYVMGGECNYLFQCTPESRLVYIPEQTYQSRLLDWTEADIQRFLDVAELNLKQCIADMKLQAQVLRKPKAVGIIPSVPLSREQLDECALSTQQCLLQYNKASSPDQGKIPFCAFNGGSDVWVDVGNKLIGVQVLQNHLGFSPRETIHVGDQFLSTGNDIATRTTCCTCWIINPQETQEILTELIEELEGKPTTASTPTETTL
ncbi:IMP-specific 5'-nucleotidase family protein [Dimargaris cristalligena]|uniref:IMP-specific 5'-nucleotidase 1 n=1 Tax=Dimargaris cristalligena TaxID=215637 RepID=A0A4P9ZYQ6_9FUNG|nr:IMP-specific 5'-nucleotidase family protein [Dimargaris cristalligena]|eukprot:RKP37910.1 IMP-specific 5'-nucleotidase family protein [Dimargaris cristalligena]